MLPNKLSFPKFSKGLADLTVSRISSLFRHFVCPRGFNSKMSFNFKILGLTLCWPSILWNKLDFWIFNDLIGSSHYLLAAKVIEFPTAPFHILIWRDQAEFFQGFLQLCLTWKSQKGYDVLSGFSLNPEVIYFKNWLTRSCKLKAWDSNIILNSTQVTCGLCDTLWFFCLFLPTQIFSNKIFSKHHLSKQFEIFRIA